MVVIVFKIIPVGQSIGIILLRSERHRTVRGISYLYSGDDFVLPKCMLGNAQQFSQREFFLFFWLNKKALTVNDGFKLVDKDIKATADGDQKSKKPGHNAEPAVGVQVFIGWAIKISVTLSPFTFYKGIIPS